MKSVFVTVGSTSFDLLSLAVLQDPCLAELRRQGYRHLILQHGQSGHSISVPSFADLWIEAFEYAPNLERYIQDAHLVISHAGAGSIIEALKAEKRLIVVANVDLMDNHQIELADKLSQDGHCIAATPSTLVAQIRTLDSMEVKQLVRSNGKVLQTVLEEELAELDRVEA